MTPLTFNRSEKIILISLPLILTMLFGIFGSDYSDQGFIRGYSWRIAQGELPYKDFIYPRPPLSIYIDYFFKALSPDSIEVLLERVRFYFQMLISVFLVLSRIPSVKDEHKLSLGIIIYLLSLGSFPAMSWHTTDGIFLSSLAFFFFGKNFGLALFFAFCAALTKQSFYPVPILFFLIGLIYKSKISSFLLGFVPLGIFLLFLYWFDIIDPFITQTNGATKLEDLLDAGFLTYFNLKTLKYAVLVSICIFIIKKQPKYFPVVILALIYEYFTFLSTCLQSDNSVVMKDWPRALLVLTTMFTLLRIRGFLFYQFLILLAIAWCSSISWGYKTPILFIIPMISGSILFLRHYDLLKYEKGIIKVALLMAICLYLTLNITRYHQGKIWENRYHLGNLNKKYNSIFTNLKTYQIYENMLKINHDFGNVTFGPDFSDSSYFLNRDPLYPIDWFLDAEIRSERRVITSLISQCESPLAIYEPSLSESYSFLGETLNKMKHISSKDFNIYCTN